MSKESFMMVSLKGDKAKKLAQVMSNPTCTRILDYLAGKEATETQIAKDLSIPLSTVHYNMQQLAAAKLVLADEFHYSEKGREVVHYKLAKQYIIIAPDDDDPGFLERLKKFVPAITIVIAAGVAIKLFGIFSGTQSTSLASRSLETSLPATPAAAPVAYNAVADQASQAAAQSAADSAASAGAAGAANTGFGAGVGGAAPAPAAAPMMAKSAAFVANEAVNETANQTINSTASTVVAQPVSPELLNSTTTAPYLPPQVTASPHWWQVSAWNLSALDWFLLGAAFVILILIIGEIISYLRARRKK